MEVLQCVEDHGGGRRLSCSLGHVAVLLVRHLCLGLGGLREVPGFSRLSGGRAHTRGNALTGGVPIVGNRNKGGVAWGTGGLLHQGEIGRSKPSHQVIIPGLHAVKVIASYRAPVKASIMDKASYILTKRIQAFSNSLLRKG